MAQSRPDEALIQEYAEAIGRNWPEPGEAKRERLAVLFPVRG